MHVLYVGDVRLKEVVERDHQGPSSKSTTSPAIISFCGIFSRQLEFGNRLHNSHNLYSRVYSALSIFEALSQCSCTCYALPESFSSPTLKVIFLLKTSILEWAVDKNSRLRIKGTSSSSVDKNSRLRIKGTSSSSAEVLQSIWKRDYFRQYAPVMCARYGVSTTSDTAYPKKSALAVLIEAPWFLIVASVEAQISLIMFEFSSCLLADSTINLVSDSSRLGLRSGYEEFPLFRW
ncbi:hypothetical protein Tco_0320040 [Tanacetum coccineum]